MKKNTLFFTGLIFTVTLTVIACNSANEKTSETDNEQTPVEVIINNNYRLVTNKSKADWERSLDQKATKQKVKLFGQMVDVELGEVKLTTNGTVELKDGELITTNDNITKATAIFDMASFKFSQNKGDGLFDVKNYPNSTLEITEIKKDSSEYTATGALTIQKTTKPVNISLNITKSENSHILVGSFSVNTLDFPLRDNVKAKDVNKDEIKIMFELNYFLSK